MLLVQPTLIIQIDYHKLVVKEQVLKVLAHTMRHRGRDRTKKMRVFKAN